MNNQDPNQRNQRHHEPPMQPWPSTAPRRARMDGSQRFGIVAAAVTIFILGAAMSAKLQGPADSNASGVVDTAATPHTVQVTPQSCIDALDQSSAYMLLNAKIMELTEKGIGAALARDANAIEDASQGIKDTRESMDLLSPGMAASSAECRAKAK